MRTLPALGQGALRSPLGLAGGLVPLLQEQDAQGPLVVAVLGSEWLPVRAEAVVPVGLEKLGRSESQDEGARPGTVAAQRAVVQLGETGVVMVALGLEEGKGRQRQAVGEREVDWAGQLKDEQKQRSTVAQE